MKKFTAYLKHHLYFIAGIAYLAIALVFFVAVTSFFAGMVNRSLPGGSEISFEGVSFHIEEYKKIQDLVGVELKKPETTETEMAETTETTEIRRTFETTEREQKEATSTEAETSPLRENVSTSTEPAILNKSSILISVLNGSGVSGAAAKVRLLLEADGFLVQKIGNTAKVQKTRLEIKDSKIAYGDVIVAVVKDLYVVHEVKGLEETEEADAIFTIGIE